MPAPLSGSFTLDAARSSVRFKHKSMWGLVTVKGGFAGIRGGGAVAEDGSGSGTLVVESATLDTKNSKRDTHLRSQDFFDVAQFPEITFSGTRITPAADGTAQVEGELTVRGTSRKLTFPVSVETHDADSVSVQGEVKISRHDYGMGWNQMGMLTGTATIVLDLRFTAA
ncbi:YceI family protein [Actinospica sp.]|jgi:polyisoprenoid-binding protein YceI|uniref:YceI family protein n=1 Tax=Actinospica sp. TaxID=1872142 RepID=UPI002CD2193B|nr:YceI family protein [Actinospica sp.]HWG23463.1 YceI family protein [Actinospica sp.]